MIWESCYWKEELARKAKELERYRHQQRWPDRAAARAERLAMTGFFEIRKLVDSHKLSGQLTRRAIPLHSYKSTGHVATCLNNHNIERLYDFASRRTCQLDLRFVCNQVIHSFVFMLLRRPTGELTHLLFSSDRKRLHTAFELSLREMIRVFRAVVKDSVDNVCFRFDAKRQDYDVSLCRGHTCSRCRLGA